MSVNLTLRSNEKYNNTWPETISDYLSSSEGIYRTAGLLDKLPKLVNGILEATGRQASEFGAALSSKFSVVSSYATTLGRTASLIKDSVNSAEYAHFKGKDHDALTPFQKKHLAQKHTATRTEAVAFFMLSLSLVTGLNPSLEKMSKNFGYGSDVAFTANNAQGLQLDVRNIMKGLEFQNSANFENQSALAKTIVKETFKQNCISATRNIIGLTTGTLGLFSSATGYTVLSKMTSSVLSTTSTVLAVIRKMHEEKGMTHKPLDYVMDVRERAPVPNETAEGLAI